MVKLLYQGHGSLRFTMQDGRVIYVDPYAGEGYDKPADVVLVTHNHSDHNKVKLITQKEGCKIITNKEALADGVHNRFSFDGLEIEAVEARNLMHSVKACVGYIITLDGIRVYCSGDTSKTKQMQEFAKQELDYALFCGDGMFNMGSKEAAECAKIVGAKHNVLIHTKPGALFDLSKAQKWSAPNKLIIQPGEELEL
ncbi:MAG: MBL fold metallo-hydrolase [Nitrososphaerota archaeon]|uniref:MBL fold metallo-hydrolase n=1 Tax=Candidatus Bathycorpusculum sp. TaxID=2994959 RepID=UPI00281CDD60|nr:MBL fold metallo-hydrolase [Candidatus Termiticorpusculum sp.]MCL2257825.1 MBL fold metallo-hydrolase [Candidatus Termiticorpusculum sp.]MCL2292042.1 MBL fold metallo-hydrolase [Candidatus Termiticorpusculum sp.]MDR0461405.1 MBL fold metallo-hydrolase [Nitrososphaerota archaeon]